MLKFIVVLLDYKIIHILLGRQLSCLLFVISSKLVKINHPKKYSKWLDWTKNKSNDGTNVFLDSLNILLLDFNTFIILGLLFPTLNIYLTSST